MSFQSIFYHWLPYIRESLNYKCHDVYHSPSFQSLKTHLSVFLTVLKKLWHPSNIKQRERGRERVSKKITFFTSWEFKTEGKANLACFKFVIFCDFNKCSSISFNGKKSFSFFLLKTWRKNTIFLIINTVTAKLLQKDGNYQLLKEQFTFSLWIKGHLVW